LQPFVLIVSSPSPLRLSSWFWAFKVRTLPKTEYPLDALSLIQVSLCFKFCTSLSETVQRVTAQHIRDFSTFSGSVSCSLSDKTFWEQQPTFPWYDTDRTENSASNNSSIVRRVFVASVTFLPSRCLATIRGYTYRQNTERDLWSKLLRLVQVPWCTYQVS
jgi:hypothetical protein